MEGSRAVGAGGKAGSAGGGKPQVVTPPESVPSPRPTAGADGRTPAGRSVRLLDSQMLESLLLGQVQGQRVEGQSAQRAQACQDAVHHLRSYRQLKSGKEASATAGASMPWVRERKALSGLRDALTRYQAGKAVRDTRLPVVMKLLAEVREELRDDHDTGLEHKATGAGKLVRSKGQPSLRLEDLAGYLDSSPPSPESSPESLAPVVVKPLVVLPAGARRVERKDAADSRASTLRVGQEDLAVLSCTMAGRGANNTVHAVRYRRGSDLVEGIFKIDTGSSAAGELFEVTGLDPKRPRWSERNVAAWRVDRLLGFGLVPRSERATLTLGGKSRPGILMNRVPGRSSQMLGTVRAEISHAGAAYLAAHPDVGSALAKAQGWHSVRLEKNTLTFDNEALVHRPSGACGTRTSTELGVAIAPVDLSDPRRRLLLVRLQWFHALIGEVDSNPGNYAWYEDVSGRPQLGAYDHDMSFGSRIRADEPVIYHRAHLPPAIDHDTRDALLAHSGQSLRAPLTDLLDEAELVALEQRLDEIQMVLLQEDQVQIVPREQAWSEPAVTRLLGVVDVPFEVQAFLQGQRQAGVNSPAGASLHRLQLHEFLEGMRRSQERVSYVARDANLAALVQWWRAGPMPGAVPRAVPPLFMPGAFETLARPIAAGPPIPLATSTIAVTTTTTTTASSSITRSSSVTSSRTTTVRTGRVTSTAPAVRPPPTTPTPARRPDAKDTS